MIKKLFSFACCFAPLGAMAAVEPLPVTGNVVDVSYSTLDFVTNSYEIADANALNGMIVRDGGITMPGDLRVWQTTGAPESGTLNIMAGTGSATGDFTLRLGGDLVARDLIVGTNGGRGFSIAAQENSATPINLTFNDVNNSGRLNLGILDEAGQTSVNNVTLANVTNNAGASFSILAGGAVSMANLTSLGNGVIDISAAGNFNADKISAAAGDTVKIAADFLKTTDSVENNGGTMELTSRGPGGIDVGGDLINAGQMTINAGDRPVIISGDAQNSSESGSLTINAGNLSINGPAAFVNKGSLTLNIDGGTTTFANGIDIRGMGADRTLTIQTGQLVFGTGASNFIANSAKSFVINVTGGGINLGVDVLNGDRNNVMADMTMTARDEINVYSLRNYGKNMTITASDVTVSGADGGENAGIIFGATADSVTNVTATNALTAGAVSNLGTMDLQSNNINVASLSNSGTGIMKVHGAANDTGTITVTGDVTNAGANLALGAQDIDIQGVFRNDAGNATIQGAAIIKLGGLNVQDGMVGINSYANQIDVTNDIRVVAMPGNDNAAPILNVGANVSTLNAKNVTIGGNLSATSEITLGVGNVNVANNNFTLNADTVNVNGTIMSTTMDARSLTVASGDIQAGSVMADNNGVISLGMGQTDAQGASTRLQVDNYIESLGAGRINIDAANIITGNIGGNGRYTINAETLTATSAIGNAINLDNGIWFDATTGTENGMVILGDRLTMATSGADATLRIANGIRIGTGKTLNLESANGTNFGGQITNNGTLNISAAKMLSAQLSDVVNTGSFTASGRAILFGDITNNAGSMTFNVLNSTNFTQALAIDGTITNNDGDITVNSDYTYSNNMVVTGGTVNITGLQWENMNNIDITGGTTRLTLGNMSVSDMTVNGDVVHSSMTGVPGALIMAQNTTVNARNINITGNMHAMQNALDYRVNNNVAISGDIIVDAPASLSISAAENKITAANVDNNGALALYGAQGLNFGTVNASGGTMHLDSGMFLMNVDTFTATNGITELQGSGLNATGTMKFHRLIQGGPASEGDVNVLTSNYTISAAAIDAMDITQGAGELRVLTDNLSLGGSIIGSNIMIGARDHREIPHNNWLNAEINGNVSGGVSFVGLKAMDVHGNYEFGDHSSIHAAVLPVGTYNDRNYWASVSLADDKTLGKITDDAGNTAKALISVDQRFISDITTLGDDANNAPLGKPQIGIDLFDMVDQGRAILLLRAQEGFKESDLTLRNLFVKFCNADGSMCFDYLKDIKPIYNDSSENLPIYLTSRDTDGDGIADSLYVVFDPRFGGPVEVFKIQPIVGRDEPHTTGEYNAAGALDNLVAGKLAESGFLNRTPIEAIPLIFKNTAMAEMAQQLYDRMEYYNTSRDGAALSRFSRLFQPREVEQLMGTIVLNEHTSFRDFEDRMYDEFIWNRNRNLNKAWLDMDFGMFTQNVSDGARADGNRFNVSGGFDWQETDTLILGLTARVSHTSGDNSDSMDLGYRVGEHIAGHVDVTVSDTNIGLGGYLIKTLGTGARLYGNAFADIHLLDVSRDQNYVGKISGDGTTFALSTEWGLLHDILNQYIVGNLYARAGYNFGFSVTEKVDGQTYMDLESDGYLMFTPGYSLIAQKRIYPNSWMQLRPYASIGIEYDVLGAPDKAKYKFGPATSFTDYHIELNPLWANVGGGFEFLMANGLQFGADYRYQYNSEIQLHQIKLSGSYRF